MVDDVAGIDQVAVDLAGHGGLGKARADRLGDVHDGDGFVELAAAAVWERDVDHWKAGIGDWGLGIRDSGFGRARAGADPGVGSRLKTKRPAGAFRWPRVRSDDRSDRKECARTWSTR